MSIQAWLGDISKQQFVADYYNKLPYSCPGGGKAFCELGSWETIGAILAQDGADVMVVRQGERLAGPAPSSLEAALQLSAEGYTLLIRHAQRHDQRLAELAAGFQTDLGGPVNIHMYATPASTYGFGWHYDAEEVFILQTTGQKQYALRKNTVNPWPLEETLPVNMGYEREKMPLVRCTLSAGDWLYIPAGYWHMGQAEETAISLAVGVMAPAAVDLYDFLRSRLLDSLLWRQRLPVPGQACPLTAEELQEHYQQLVKWLSRDLDQLLGDPRLLRDFQQHLVERAQARPPE